MLAELEKTPPGGDYTSEHVTRMGKKPSPYKEILDGAGLSYKKAAQWQLLAANREKVERVMVDVRKKEWQVHECGSHTRGCQGSGSRLFSP